MDSEKSTEKTPFFASARRRQRYRYIKYLCEMQGLRVSDLHASFVKRCARSGKRPCHYSVFYRVCQGLRSSSRIEHFIATALKVPHEELWS